MFFCFLAVFGAHGIDLNRPIVTLCYNGNLAALVALAFHEAGKEDVAVYYVSIASSLMSTAKEHAHQIHMLYPTRYKLTED